MLEYKPISWHQQQRAPLNPPNISKIAALFLTYPVRREVEGRCDQASRRARGGLQLFVECGGYLIFYCGAPVDFISAIHFSPGGGAGGGEEIEGIDRIGSVPKKANLM